MSEHHDARTFGMWGKRAALGVGILVFGLLILAVSNGRAYSMSNGTITGFSTKGCVCHGPAPSPGVKVDISGPATVTTGQTAQYTVSVKGSPEAGGGVDVSATGGKLSAGENTQLANGEITHKDRNSRSWTFSWMSPATPGKYTLRAAGNAVNKDGTPNGDGWNLGTLDISVVESAPAAPVVGGTGGVGSTPASGNGGPVGVSPAAPPAPKPPALVVIVPSAKSGVAMGIVTALLKDGAGKPISGSTVNFYVDTQFFLGTGNVPVQTTRGSLVQDYGAQEGKVQGLMAIGDAKTDANGVATLKYTPSLSGDLKLVARYDAGSDGVIENTATWAGVQAANSYVPDIGIDAPFLNPKVVLGIVLGTIWSIFLFVLYQVIAISRDKTAYKEGR